MLMAAVILNMLAALGLLALSGKYLLGPAPTDYHAEILRKNGVEVTGIVPVLFRAINVALGSSVLALAVVLAGLTWFGVQQDIGWAKGAVVIAGLLAGLPSAAVTYRMEARTGVRTPWRAAFGLTVIFVVAFGLSVL